MRKRIPTRSQPDAIIHARNDLGRSTAAVLVDRQLNPNHQSMRLPVVQRQRAAMRRRDGIGDRKTKAELGKTKTALSIAGKAFALLEEISESADSDAKPNG